MEAAVVVLRWAQYVSAFLLMGGGLFAVYGLPAAGAASATALRWPRRLLTGSAIMLLAASLLGLLAQTAILAGDPAAALDASVLGSVLQDMAMGPSSLARTLAAAAASGLLGLARPGRSLWIAIAILGAIASASMAWMGHGAATEGLSGALHLVADILHLWAAAIWIGALGFFLGLAFGSLAQGDQRVAYHAALAGFSGIGSGLVALLLATGVVNSGFLIGPAGLTKIFNTPYGQLLVAKLALFGLMLFLAAANRFRHTPALQKGLDDPDGAIIAITALRRSLMLETAAALAVIALVAWLGRLAPIASQ